MDGLDFSKISSDHAITNKLNLSFSKPHNYTLAILDSIALLVVQECFLKSYPDIVTNNIHSNDGLFPTSIKKYTYITMNRKRLSSVAASVADKTAKVPYDLAKPNVSFTYTGIESRPVQILYIFKHCFKLKMTLLCHSYLQL